MKIYSFQERVPEHNEKILVFQKTDTGKPWNFNVTKAIYPYKKNEHKYKNNYFYIFSGEHEFYTSPYLTSDECLVYYFLISEIKDELNNL